MASVVAIALAISLVAYGALGSYARRAHVSRNLAPQGGEVNIADPSTGRVAQLRFKERQTVAAGDVPMVLDTDRASPLAGGAEGFGNAAAQVAKQIELRRLGLQKGRSTRNTQATVRSRAIQDRLLSLDAELTKLADEIALQTRRCDLPQRSVKRYEDLVASEFISLVQAQAQQEALIDQDGRLRALERASLNPQRERTGLVSEQKQIAADLATAQASMEREFLALDQEATENTARRSTVVVAPLAGTVSAVAISQGQWASAGQSLAAIHPQAAPLEALLFAPSRTAGCVAPGQRVLVRYAAYPYQKFGPQSGVVATVSQSAFAPIDLPPALQPQFGRQTTEALYRVIVTLDSQSIATYGNASPLKAGMPLDADIVRTAAASSNGCWSAFSRRPSGFDYFQIATVNTIL